MKIEIPLYIPPSLSTELKKLKLTNLNRYILQAFIKKIKRDFNIEIDITDRRRKGKMYRTK